jgi:molybdopterin-guanine dinucleotide biosynthesis protein A
LFASPSPRTRRSAPRTSRDASRPDGIARTGRLIGAIIAGGANSRFGGEAKGLHTVAGRRIIDRVADALRGAVSGLLLITGAPHATTWLPGVPVVPDTWRKRGSLVGIHSALTHAKQPILLAAWDMPFVTTDLFTLIGSHASESAFAAVPESDSGLEPFCAVYTPACLPWIERALADDDLRLTNLLARLPEYHRISVADVRAIGDPRRLFFNVNAPPDLARAEELAAAG